MADKIALEVVTPERRVVAEQVDEVVLPSMTGYMGVRPGHAPLLAALDVGEVHYRIGNETCYMTVCGGFAEVLPESVSILAEKSELADEIDLERAEQAKQRAEGRLKGDLPASEFRHAEIKLKRAITRIGVHGKRR